MSGYYYCVSWLPILRGVEVRQRESTKVWGRGTGAVGDDVVCVRYLTLNRR